MKLYEYKRWPAPEVELVDYEIFDEPLFGNGFKDIQNDWTVIDVGAAIGYYTVLAAEKARQGQVIAVEPHPEIIKVLQKNIHLHELKNVRVIHRALAAENADKQVRMTEGFGRGGTEIIQPRAPLIQRLSSSIRDGSLFLKIWRRLKPGKPRRQFLASACTLDQLVAELGLQRVDLVKMDIQGAEYDALHGAHETLEKLRPILLIEIHYRDQWSPVDLTGFLQSHHYLLKSEQIGRSCLLRADPQ